MSITLSLQSGPVVENSASGFGAGQLTVVVSLSEPSLEPVRAQYRLRDGSAGDDDLLYLSNWFRNFGTVEFAPGETEQTIVIETRPDTDIEPSEAFSVELFNPVGASLSGGGPLLQTVGIILDDDGPAPMAPDVFVSAPVAVVTGDTNSVPFDVVLSAPAVSPMRFLYETLGHRGEAVTGAFTIEAGQSSVRLQVPLPSDMFREGVHEFGLRMIQEAAAQEPTFAQAQVIVPADTDLPTLAVFGDTGLENVGPVDGRLGFTVVLSQPSDEPVSVEYYLSGGTADDTDLNASFADASNAGTVVFEAGQTVATVQVALQTDGVSERDESFSLHLVNPVGAVFAGNLTAISALGVVLDNDANAPPPELVIEDAGLRGEGDSRFAEFSLSLSRALDEDATVTFQTKDGVIAAGSGFTHTFGQVVFAAGQVTVPVYVPLSASETAAVGSFFLTATLASESLVDQPVVRAEAWMGDADLSQSPTVSARGLEVVWVQGQPNVARFVVSLSHAAEGEISVPYLLSPHGPFDPTALGVLNASGTVTFSAGQTTALVDVALDEDVLLAADTALWLELYDPEGARIHETQVGQQAISLLRSPQDIYQSLFLIHRATAEDEYVIELRLSRPVDVPTVIEYTSHSSGLSEGSVLFEPGQDQAFVRVPFEIGADRQVAVSASVQGSDAVSWIDLTPPHPVTGDSPVVTVTAGSVYEDKGLGSNDLPFVIMLSTPAAEALSIAYQLRLGTVGEADLAGQSMTGTVEVQAGQTRVVLPVTSAFDALSERDETVFLDVFASDFVRFEGGQDVLSTVGFLLDNDGDVLPSVAVSDVQIKQGETAEVAVHLSRALTQDTAFSVTVSDEGAAEAFVLSQDTVTFQAGQTVAYLNMSALPNGASLAPLSVSLQQINAGSQDPLQSSFRVEIMETSDPQSASPVYQTGTADNDLLIGGAASDTLSGLAGDDQLFGAGGDDIFLPGAGNDTVNGGDGTDMMSFVDATAGVAIDMTLARAVSGAEIDTWTGIENVTGSIFADFVLTDAGENRVRTLGSYDWIVGSDGFDFIDGGAGRDMLSYVYASARVVVDLGLQRGLEGQAAGDRFASIERLTGSIFSDRFLGSDGADDFRGLGGDDWFVGSNGGRDRYDGGTGSDTVAYSLAAQGVTASLTEGIFGLGQAALDLYTAIENLTGSSFDDLLIGDAGRNTLRGLYGEDTLRGMAGNDRLSGGASDDVLDGGAGWDVAVYTSNAVDYQIAQVGDAVEVRTLGTSREGTDVLIDIEAIQFADTLVFL